MAREKVCVVIGAGDATGGAIARRFARDGYTAVVTRRSADKLKPLADRIVAEGGKVHAFGSDARDEAQVVELFGILRRDDEPELVAITGAALFERFEVGIVGRRPVGTARPALAIDAFALDVAQVRRGRTRPGLRQIHQPGLDRHAPRIRPKSPPGEARRDVAAAQPGTGPLADFARCFAELRAGLVGLPQHLVDEGIAALLGRTRSNAETVVVALAHGATPSKAVAVQRTKHATSPTPMRRCAPSRHAAVPRRVPRHPHVQTRFSSGHVPRPLILPSAFAPR